MSDINQQIENLKPGDIIGYTYPGLTLVYSSGNDKGVFIRFTKNGKNIVLEDCEVQAGETKKYQHYISKSQITNVVPCQPNPTTKP